MIVSGNDARAFARVAPYRGSADTGPTAPVTRRYYLRLSPCPFSLSLTFRCLLRSVSRRGGPFPNAAYHAVNFGRPDGSRSAILASLGSSMSPWGSAPVPTGRPIHRHALPSHQATLYPVFLFLGKLSERIFRGRRCSARIRICASSTVGHRIERPSAAVVLRMTLPVVDRSCRDTNKPASNRQARHRHRSPKLNSRDRVASAKRCEWHSPIAPFQRPSRRQDLDLIPEPNFPRNHANLARKGRCGCQKSFKRLSILIPTTRKDVSAKFSINSGRSSTNPVMGFGACPLPESAEFERRILPASPRPRRSLVAGNGLSAARSAIAKVLVMRRIMALLHLSDRVGEMRGHQLAFLCEAESVMRRRRNSMRISDRCGTVSPTLTNPRPESISSSVRPRARSRHR